MVDFQFRKKTICIFLIGQALGEIFKETFVPNLVIGL